MSLTKQEHEEMDYTSEYVFYYRIGNTSRPRIKGKTTAHLARRQRPESTLVAGRAGCAWRHGVSQLRPCPEDSIAQ